MGIDPLKPKGPTTVSPPTQAAPVDTPPAPDAPSESGPPAAAEGFDDPKKKLVSVTGGYVAFKPNFAPREDLKALVDAQRVGGVSTRSTRSLQDAAVSTAANLGAAPGPRPAAADFMAQAKAANPKATPAQLEAAACKLGKAALEKDFGFNVKNGDQPWKAEELSRAYESFAGMPAADQAKLKGLDLIRQKEAPPESTAEAGGVVAGEYSPNVATTNGKRDHPGSITLYNAAFDGASRQDTMHVVTHEAGHAVEGRARDDAMEKFNEAVNNQTSANDVLSKTLGPSKQAWDDYSAAAKGYSFRSNDKPAVDFAKQQEAVGAAMNKLQSAKTPAEVTAAQTKLDAAKVKRDAALAKMSGSKSEGAAKAWASASDAAEGPVKTYTAAHVDYLKAKGVADDAQTKLTGLSTAADGKTSKERAAFSRAKGTEKSVSSYGKKNDTEGYAEAYALYQRDPALMKKQFPNQYKFFHAHHQSPNDP